LDRVEEEIPASKNWVEDGLVSVPKEMSGFA
jgi:hypothetical protein